MEVLIIIGLILGIVVWFFVAVEFKHIAALKGYDQAKYFWWTFFLGPVGMLMVVALPQEIKIPAAPAPIVQAPPAEAPLSDELPDI